jgi:hypothetical protein
LIAIACDPFALIAKFKKGALDQAGAFRPIIAFDAVFPTGKTIDASWVSFYNVAHCVLAF